VGGFKEEELEANPSLELQQTASVESSHVDRTLSGPAKLRLDQNSYHIVDFGTNLTGFLGAQVRCPKKTRLYLVFDEILSDGDVDFKRLSAVNIVAVEMEKGTYKFETIEPYTLQYLKLIVLEGECETDEVYLREYVNPNVWRAHFASSDERLNRLFAAGRETFRQNALDIFMDCPSRERAGWLCDSFFTARVAPDLGGDTLIEKNFFENYLLPERFAFLPKCMLPMCYPADHYSGRFIPNWSLWFVLELEEYLARSGDRRMVDALEPKVMCLLDYFKQFQNEDGLLEKLKSWVFIEWSAANKFVQDVNYPSNMLYAAALAAAGQKPELLREAQKIRGVIRRQSFDGEFFADNAVRKNGQLEVTRNRTEVCQYFAFFFDTATPESHPALWQILLDKFGPNRAQSGEFPQVHAANAFVGNMLRLELLARHGRVQQLLDESISYLLYMAETTGTLWENTTPTASCNHGFSSHIVHTLYRDVLGLYKIDAVSRTVRIRLSDLRLNWCEGAVPVEGGRISLRWRKDGDRILYRIDAPSGYTVSVENRSGKELVAER
jgi:alpha-L-rhamnosidase